MDSTNISRDFFEALGSRGNEGTMRVLNQASFDVSTQAPSPRVLEIIDKGEWDSK
jgi:hypothetical protein